MPYTIKDPPDKIKSLPEHGQHIWIEAFNSAYDQHEGDPKREERANRIAWAAVKNKYAQRDDGEWVPKDSQKTGGLAEMDDHIANTAIPSGTPLEAPVLEKDFKLFIPITKVDELKREVWGDCTLEENDRADEIMDYESSKPYFIKWSEAARQRTAGKSLGNVRAMHQPIAAGKVIDFTPDDARRAFPIGTYIGDNQEWQKCLDGIYSGFSVGGKYVKRWMDHNNGRAVMRYTADPNEVSLVDIPAVPHATFQLIKADGTIENREFAKEVRPAEPMMVHVPDVVADTATPSGIPAPATAPESLMVEVSGKMPLSGLIPHLQSVIQKMLPSPVTKPTPRPVDGETILQHPTLTTPQVLDPNASPPTGARLQENHPAAQTITPPAASRSLRKTRSPVIPGFSTPQSVAVSATEKDWPVNKKIEDAPNLRQAEEGSMVNCGSCEYFRWLQEGYCWLYDFPTQYSWTCDSFELRHGEGETSQQVADPAISARAQPAPVAVAAIAKKDLVCPHCGKTITVEKAGDFRCDYCGKTYKAEADGEGYRILVSEDASKLAMASGISKKDKIDPVLVNPDGQTQDYADPVNKAWLLDTKQGSLAKVFFYNRGVGRNVYSDREWALLGRRITRMASAKTGFQYQFDPREKKIEREQLHSIPVG